MSQNRQNIQNHHLAWAAAQPRRRRKAAGWLAFPYHKKGFVGFCMFCDKKQEQ